MNLPQPKQLFGIDIRYDLDRSVTMIDKDIQQKKAFKFNVEGGEPSDKPNPTKEKAQQEAQSWAARNADKIGQAFMNFFKGKSKYEDERTEVQREIDRLGGIWTDKRPINAGGLSNYELLLRAGSPGGSLYNYATRNKKEVFVSPLLNVVQAYRLGEGKPGYELIPTNVLNVAVAFIRWAKLVYGSDVVNNVKLKNVDKNMVELLKQSLPPVDKNKVDDVQDTVDDDNTGGGGGGSGSGMLTGKNIVIGVAIIAVVIILIRKI